MFVFRDIEEVEEWLDPLGYAAFWEAITPWDILSCADRAHCDATISNGIAPELTVLKCMKALVRLELTQRLGLSARLYELPEAQCTRRTH